VTSHYDHSVMDETIGSLCSGVGGLDWATLLRPAWHAEIEPGPAALLAAQHPGVPNLGDFRVTDWSAVEPVTEMTMGVPCQPFSAAGRQQAEADGRYLWPSAYAGIVALRPPRVFFENVRNLVSIKGGTVWRGILDDLREAGYLCRWLILGACAVGAPHHRHRVFLMAWHVGAGAPPAERVEIVSCADSAPMLRSPSARDGGARGQGSPEHMRRRMEASHNINLGDQVVLLRWEAVTGHSAPEPTELGPRGGRRLAAPFAEWMMGYAPGYLTDHLDRRQALKAAGNGVVTRQAYRARWMLMAAGSRV
jgi:DNA (cytosine-5)-methyltransferase 1